MYYYFKLRYLEPKSYAIKVIDDVKRWASDTVLQIERKFLHNKMTNKPCI